MRTTSTQSDQVAVHARMDRPVAVHPPARSSTQADAPVWTTGAPDPDHRLLRDVFGTFATGVVSLAAMVDGRPVGLAVSSFTSVSLDPPLASVSISRSSSTWRGLRRAPRLGITVLGAHQATACRSLAGPADRRFARLNHRRTATGAVFLDGGLADLECSIHREVEAGDHSLVLLNVHGIASIAAVAPLIVYRSGFTSVPTPSSQIVPSGTATRRRVDQEGAWSA